MTLLRWFFSPFRRTPSPQKILHILAKDEARAQAQWQLLKKKLRRKIKDQQRRIRLETWGTQLFDKLRDNYHRVDLVLTNKNPTEKDQTELLIEKLENSCEDILHSFPSRKIMTRAQKWQSKVLRQIKDHLDFLDHLLFELEE